MNHLRFVTGVIVLMSSVAVSTTHAAEPKHTSSEQSAHTRTLDLKLAPLSRIFTPQQIDAVLSRTIELEHVQVEAPRLGHLPLQSDSDDIATIFTDVVRIFAPSSTYAARVNYTPDVTAANRPVPIMLSMYHPNFPPPYSQR